MYVRCDTDSSRLAIQYTSFVLQSTNALRMIKYIYSKCKEIKCVVGCLASKTEIAIDLCSHNRNLPSSHTQHIFDPTSSPFTRILYGLLAVALYIYMKLYLHTSARYSHFDTLGLPYMHHTEACANQVPMPDILVSHYIWLIYLLEEHAMIGCSELFYGSINVIGHPC